MTALAYCVCSAALDIWELTDALWRSGFSVRKSADYLRYKRRLLRFQKNCGEVWFEQRRPLLLATSARGHKVQQQQQEQQVQKPVKSLRESERKMHRRGIDFAAIEASVEAAEEVDVGSGGDRQSFSSDRYDFAQMERQAIETSAFADDIEVISGTEIDATFYDYDESLPVYRTYNIGQLHEGVSFTIFGYLPGNCERFAINFVLNNESEDIALHINPRLPQNYIVRNTKAKNVWGREEVTSALPFSLRRGSKFTMQVLLTNSKYMITVNGYHFATFEHRLPYKAIGSINVKGDVEFVNIERAIVSAYPDRRPESRPKEIRCEVSESPRAEAIVADDGGDYDVVDTKNIPKAWRTVRLKHHVLHTMTATPPTQLGGLSLPYYGCFPPKSLIAGRSLKIQGRVKLLPHSFYINLQQGQNIWPHPVIALHFNPRFSKQSGAVGKAIVCRNAWHNGSWVREERSELDTDFRPGKTFTLSIACNELDFKVYLNRKLITEFQHQMDPSIVDTVYIQGDIKLWDVMLQDTNNVFTPAKPIIYENPSFTYE